MSNLIGKKAYVKQIIHSDTRYIPEVEIGTYVGIVVNVEHGENCLIWIDQSLIDKDDDFGWESDNEVGTIDKPSGSKFWWILREDLYFKENIKELDIE